ncbi:MAG: hypothetical protein ACLPIX_05180 [Rhodomicrobium sp.]
MLQIKFPDKLIFNLAYGVSAYMDENGIKFHIAEYSMLREELQLRFKQSQELVFFSTMTNGFIISWISTQGLTNSMKVINSVALFVPLFISVVAWSMYRLRVRRQNDIYNYLAKLELHLSKGELGWHKFLSARKNKGYGLFAPRHVYHFVLLVQILIGALLPTISYWRS